MNKVVPIRKLPDEPLRRAEATRAWLAGLDVGEATLRNYRLALEAARTFFSIREINAETLTEYRRHLGARGLAPSSINTYLHTVKQFCAAHYTPSPAAGLRTRRVERFTRLALSRDDAAKLLAEPCESAIDYRNRAVLALALICGLRAREITRLRDGDYTTESGTRVLRVHGKGRQTSDQVAATPAPLAAIIDDWLERRPASDWLFCALDRAHTGQRLSVRSVSGIGRRALDAIGLTDAAYTFHALRHTAACLLLERGNDYAQAQTLMRHASIDTTRIYTHTVARRQRLTHPPEAVLCQALLEEHNE